MAQKKTFLVGVAAIVVLSVATVLQADTKITVSHRAPGVVIRSPIGFGIWIGRPPVRPLAPVHGKLVVPGPWRRRFVALGSPHGRRIKHHTPAVTVVHPPVVTRRAPVVCERGPITVWITNSNGSRTSVKLTREGPWYVGPRGEYYAEMPTNGQLRVVYGF